jgi:hypothetical protein
MVPSFAIAAAALAAAPCTAADAPYSPFKFQLGAAPGLDSWFKDAKLGMFMHWAGLLTSRGPWGPTGPLGTPSRTPWILSG